MLTTNIGNHIFIGINWNILCQSSVSKTNILSVHLQKKYFEKLNKSTNYWVDNSVMKPVEAEYFQIRKEVTEGTDWSKTLIKWRYFKNMHSEKALDLKRKLRLVINNGRPYMK